MPSGQQIRVLRVIGGLDPLVGGPSESAANSCIASQRVGVLNTLVFPTASEMQPRIAPVRQELHDEGVAIHTFPLMAGALESTQRWSISPKLATWLLGAMEQYDVVHVHGAWGFSPLAGALAASRSRRPCVMTPHEALTTFDVYNPGNPLRPPAKKALKRLYVKLLSSIVFASALEERDSLFLPAVRSVVIPHALRRAVSTPLRPPRSDSEPLKVGFLGRLHPKKNVDVLIRAIHAASRSARLMIAGEGPIGYRRELEKLAEELSIADRIEWLGFLNESDRWAFIDNVDLLAMPSRYEGFGMVAAEAMARGTASVVSENTGVAELVRRHSCGMIASPTVDGFAGALRTLEADAHLLATLAARGPSAARDELSLEAHGEALKREYESLLYMKAEVTASTV
jgi:glycosyltransferase involved in cell wall biosynthesis